MIYGFNPQKYAEEIFPRIAIVEIRTDPPGMLKSFPVTPVMKPILGGYRIQASTRIKVHRGKAKLVGWGFRDAEGRPLNDKVEAMGTVRRGDNVEVTLIMDFTNGC